LNCRQSILSTTQMSEAIGEIIEEHGEIWIECRWSVSCKPSAQLDCLPN
jgi:hypothetical protein